MKDYYDLYYLANKFDFDGAVLTEALRKTFVNRNRQFTLEQFVQIMTGSLPDIKIHMKVSAGRSRRRLYQMVTLPDGGSEY